VTKRSLKHKLKKTTKHQFLIGKYAFSRAKLAAIILAFGIIGGYVLIHSFAATTGPPPPPTIYLDLQNQTLPVNSNFTVTIREDSGTTAINAVQANLSYPANLIDFVSIDSSTSAFDVNAAASGGAGVIDLARGKTGTLTGPQVVAVVTFHTKTTSGAANIAFTSGTALVNSTNNQDLLGSLAATRGGTYTVDTPPTISLTAPLNGATIKYGNTQTISSTATDAETSVSSVGVFIDGTSVATLTTSPYNYSWNTNGAALGSHTIQTKATDTTGNVSSSAVAAVTLADQTAPTASITAPVGGAVIRGSAVPVSATSTDNIGTVGVQFKLDGVNLGAEDTTSPYSISWDTTTATNAAHSLTAVARDAAGNTFTSSAVSVTADNVVPTVSITAPAAGATISGSSVAVSANATDNVSVSSVQFKVDGNNVGSSDTTSPYSTTLNTTALTNAAHNLTAVATDSAGNTTTSSAISITVNNVPPDTTPPTVSITAPTNNATVSGASVNVSATASDNVGVASVQFKLDGSNLGSLDTTSPYSTTLNTTSLANGNHTLTAVASDAAGNSTPSATITINVNNVVIPPPDTTAPTTPANLHSTATTTSSISLAWNASTDSGGSGLLGYKLYRNGTFIQQTSSLSFTDSGLAANTSYAYKITAIDNANNESAQSTVLNISTAANPPPPPTNNADLNHDGVVDIFDLSLLLANYGRTGTGDIDNNGIVDIFDLSRLLSQYQP
jgi:hypothetical protein